MSGEIHHLQKITNDHLICVYPGCSYEFIIESYQPFKRRVISYGDLYAIHSGSWMVSNLTVKVEVK